MRDITKRHYGILLRFSKDRTAWANYLTKLGENEDHCWATASELGAVELASKDLARS